MKVQGATPWLPAVQLMSILKNGQRKLACVVAGTPNGNEWTAAAIETSAAADTATQVFDDHGHKLIGKYRTIERAMAACEKYAGKWLSDQQHVPACGCPEIGTEAAEKV